MDAGTNNVIYMELHSGPKMANGTRGKTTVAEMIDRGSTVFVLYMMCRKTQLKIIYIRIGKPGVKGPSVLYIMMLIVNP